MRTRPEPDASEGVDSNSRTARKIERRQFPSRRHGPAVGLHGLHVDANLDRRPARLGNLRLRQADIFKRLTARQPNLQLNQVHPGNRFRDGVLDLQARIGLDEVVPGSLDEEFECAQVPVVRGPRERNRRGDHALAH